MATEQRQIGFVLTCLLAALMSVLAIQLNITWPLRYDLTPTFVFCVGVSFVPFICFETFAMSAQARSKEEVTQLVVDFTSTYVLRHGLGLNDVFSAQVSGAKRLLFLMLMVRVVLNMSALAASCWQLWSGGTFVLGSLLSIPIAVEAALAVILPFRVLAVLVAWAAGYPNANMLVSELKHLAGFSSLRLLLALNPTMALRDWERLSRRGFMNEHWWMKPFGFVVFLIRTLVVIILGLAVLFAKMEKLDLQALKDQGFKDPIDALLAMRFLELKRLEFVQFLMFSNQMVSFADLETLEMDRLQLFLFARTDAKYQFEEEKLKERHMESLLMSIWKVQGVCLFDRLAAIFTFASDDFQRSVIGDAPASLGEEIALSRPDSERGVLLGMP